jgi:hypothetical protein
VQDVGSYRNAVEVVMVNLTDYVQRLQVKQ